MFLNFDFVLKKNTAYVISTEYIQHCDDDCLTAIPQSTM